MPVSAGEAMLFNPSVVPFAISLHCFGDLVATLPCACQLIT
jgi:hypothetical protein